jgi:large subunit ribosomal protein L9
MAEKKEKRYLSDNAQLMSELRNKESSEQFRADEDLKAAKAYAAKINGQTVVIKAKGGANGKLFGSVTAKEIAQLISTKFGIKVDKRKITVDDIKAFGTYNTQVRLHPQVTADFKVQVVEE